MKAYIQSSQNGAGFHGVFTHHPTPISWDPSPSDPLGGVWYVYLLFYHTNQPFTVVKNIPWDPWMRHGYLFFFKVTQCR